MNKKNLVPILFNAVDVFYDIEDKRYKAIIEINGKDYYGELEECE